MFNRICALLAVGMTAFAIFVNAGGCTPEHMQYARTANDAAKLACEAFAQEEAPKVGISVNEAIKRFCGDLRPWLDAILGANKMAAQKAGLSPPGDGG